MTAATDLLEHCKPWLCFDSREHEFARVFGRIAYENGDEWATYWLWYACDWSPLPWRHGHRGDWEYVQYRLVDSITISEAAYAQHAGGEHRRYDHIHWDGFRPVVYPELGRHASMFEPSGWHHRDGMDFARANGRGRCVDPELEFAPVGGWATRSFGDDPSSPLAPGRTLRWHKPSTWAASLDRV